MVERSSRKRILRELEFPKIVGKDEESRRIATKIHILNLAKVESPTNRPHILCKDFSDTRSKRFRESLGIAVSPTTIDNIIDDLSSKEKNYINIEGGRPRKYSLTSKGEKLLKGYTLGIKIRQARIKLNYIREETKLEKISKAMTSLAMWERETASLSEDLKSTIHEMESEKDAYIIPDPLNEQRDKEISQHDLEMKLMDKIDDLKNQTLENLIFIEINQEEESEIRKIRNYDELEPSGKV